MTKYTLMPHQQATYEYLLAHEYFIMNLEIGVGKAQPLWSKVLTPNGWVRMGDLEAGDVVLNGDLKPTRVAATYSHKSKDIYRCEFSDGAVTYCCDEHLWQERQDNGTTKVSPWRTHALRDFKDDLFKSNGGKKRWIPYIQDPIPFYESYALPVDPYVIGVLIGDGGPTFQPELHTPDDYIFETVKQKVEQETPEVSVKRYKSCGCYKVTFPRKKNKGPCKNPFKAKLGKLGMLGKKSYHKRIPDIYFKSSISDRKELLAGLLDTDGTYTKTKEGKNGFGHVEFCTASEGLARDVVELVRSLGGYSRIRTRKAFYTKKTSKGVERVDMDRTYYRVSVKTTFNPFKLPRKADRWVAPTKYLPARAFTKVEYHSTEPAKCISLEGENKLYITDDFVVTHNTLVVIHYALMSGKPVLIVCPAYLVDNWAKEIAKFAPNLVVHTFKKGKDLFHPFDTDICVTSYDLSIKAESLYTWAHLIAFDEAQHLKEISTKRTETIHRLVYENEVPRVALLTGTPILNRVYEFYSLMALCNYNPKLGDDVKFLKTYPHYVEFAEQFSYRHEYNVLIKNRRRKRVTYKGIKNKDKLKNWLKGIFIRFTSDKLNLPDGIDIPVQMDKYTEDSELLAAFNKAIDTDIGDKAGAEAKCKAAMAKAPFTVKYVKNLIEGGMEKVVIFTDHVASAEYIAEQLGITAITGGVSTKRRTAIVDDFIENPETIPIVGTYGAMSTGLTLVVAADEVLNDYCWVPGVLEQAKGRIRRKGQTRVCRYHYILGSPQDEYIVKTLKEKTETIREALS